MHRRRTHDPGRPTAEPNATTAEALLAKVEPGPRREVALPTGRRCEVESDGSIDRFTLRDAGGEVLMHVTLTDSGPVLSFSSAEIELCATRRLTLNAQKIDV